MLRAPPVLGRDAASNSVGGVFGRDCTSKGTGACCYDVGHRWLNSVPGMAMGSREQPSTVVVLLCTGYSVKTGASSGNSFMLLNFRLRLVASRAPKGHIGGPESSPLLS